ncbi:MAG: MOSC domain-containing protein [Hyphomicrobiaceae bacterium]
MSTQTQAKLTEIFRYPVKGLSPERLQSVTVEANATLALDRIWAVENGAGRFDPEAPKHLPKINFLMLMRNEKLATLKTEYDAASETLTIRRDNKQVARGQLSTKIGRQMIEQFLAAYMKDCLRGAPKITRATGHSFSDVAAKCVHIVNLASLRELERVIGRPVHPIRFRANLYLDGLAPWSEFDLVGRTFKIGDIQLTGLERTIRCAATNVDPETGARDLNIPAVIKRTWGFSDFGIYANIDEAGTLNVGDLIET